METMSDMHYDENSSFSDYANYTLIYEKRKDEYLKCLASRVKDTDKEVIVADFGTNDGGNIMPIFDMFAGYMKQEATGKQIKFIFNDKDPAVKELLFRKLKAKNTLMAESHVSIETIIGDCYKDCLPEESLDVGFCMFVLQFLSTPCAIQNGLTWDDCDEKELQQIKAIAEHDWIQFLNSRCKELKPGGFLITVIPGAGKEDFFLIPRRVHKDMFQRNDIWKDEFERTALHAFGARTKSDLKKPFEDGSISELELLEVNIETVYLENLGLTCDTASNYYKSFLLTTIMNGLSGERTEKNKQQICDLYFERLRKELQVSRDEFKSFGIHFYECVIQKRSEI